MVASKVNDSPEPAHGDAGGSYEISPAGAVVLIERTRESAEVVSEESPASIQTPPAAAPAAASQNIAHD